MAKLKLNIPVKKGDQIELNVETLASSGDGLCRQDGYTLFTPGGLPGDRIVGKVIKVTPRFGVVKVFKVTALSMYRVDPPCPVFFECGGCKFQNLSYEQQLRFKVKIVRDSLERIGHIEAPKDIPVIPSDSQYYYRNKGSFAIQGNAGKPEIGFYAEGTHDVADSSTCNLLLPAINEAKEWLRQVIETHKISIYHEYSHRGLLRGLIIRHSHATGQTLIGIVTNKGKFPRAFLADLTKKEKLNQLGIVGLIQNINPQKTNVILGKESKVLWGKDHFQEILGEIKFSLSLGSFFQVHSQQAKRLYDLIDKWTKHSKGQTLVDAYSGSGGIALWLAKQGHKMIGIEKFEFAMQDAKKSAELNGLLNCHFITGTVEDNISKFVSDKSIHTFIVDPPRKGCSEKVIQALIQIKPEQIIYVSCNPSTLARDLERLTDYRIQDIQVIDMFPQTQHIETAILATRINVNE